jgi:phosphatidylserine synthase
MTSPLGSFRLANALTYASLSCGVGALSAAIQGNQAACGALLATAVVCDTFDGQFARRLRRASRDTASRTEFGGELDSLVDAVTFGAMPVVCAGLLFDANGFFWWAAVFVYICCAVTRLGFYNLTARATTNPRPDFVGLPSPVAALFWSSALLFDPHSALLVVLAVSMGAAMIAPFRIARPTGAGLLVFALWPATLMAAHGMALASR